MANTNGSGVLAEIVVGLYFDRPVDLRKLDKLDDETFALALSLIRYRPSVRWQDNDLYELAKCAAEILNQRSKPNNVCCGWADGW